MRQQKIIAVDVDGVCADLDTEWLRRYNLESGDDLTPDKLNRWEIEEQVKPGWKKRFYEILLDPGIYSSVHPYPDALEAVQQLRELGRVVYLTSTPVNHLLSKFDWLQFHGFLPKTQEAINDYLPIRDKWLVDADVLLDDRVKNVEEFPGLAYLVNRRHNERLPCSRPRLFGYGLKSAPRVLRSAI